MKMNTQVLSQFKLKSLLFLSILFGGMSICSAFESEAAVSDPWKIIKTNWHNEMPDPFGEGPVLDEPWEQCLELLAPNFELILEVRIMSATNGANDFDDIYAEVVFDFSNGATPSSPTSFTVGPAIAGTMEGVEDCGLGLYETRFFITVPFADHCPNNEDWTMSYVATLLTEDGDPYGTQAYDVAFPYDIFQSYDELGSDITYAEEKQLCCWNEKYRTSKETKESELNLETQFAVFPSPFQEELIVALEGNTSESINGHLMIYSVDGQLVYDRKMESQESLVVQTHEFLPGLYTCQLITPNGVVSKKVLKM